MDNEEDKLAIYSFGKASEFYEKKLKNKDLKILKIVQW